MRFLRYGFDRMRGVLSMANKHSDRVFYMFLTEVYQDQTLNVLEPYPTWCPSAVTYYSFHQPQLSRPCWLQLMGFVVQKRIPPWERRVNDKTPCISPLLLPLALLQIHFTILNIHFTMFQTKFKLHILAACWVHLYLQVEIGKK